MRTAGEVVELAGMLRQVCVLILVYGEPGRELAGWCLRMLAEPGYAERAATAVAHITDS